MVYNIEEKKKRHVMSQIKYQQGRLISNPGACFWSGCMEQRAERDGKLLRYCPKHLQSRAEYQRQLYKKMLESDGNRVRVTEIPKEGV